MSLILGIFIGVVVAVVAIALVYHNNVKWFASTDAKLAAIAAKVGADLSKL